MPNEYYQMAYNDYLAHHGIKGQKWGVRRFENYDGTLTAAGKERYYGSNKSGKALEREVYRHINEIERKYANESDDRKDEELAKYLATIDRSQINNRSEYHKYITSKILSIATLDPNGIINSINRRNEYVQGEKLAKEIEAERVNEKVDKVTGFKIKSNKKMTPEEDLIRVNPHVHDFNSNTKRNCVFCSVAYEMRRRGYDVSANKSGMGYIDSEWKRWFPKAKIKSYDEQKQGLLQSDPGYTVKYASKVIKAIEKQPNGSRGTILVNFRSGGGHSMYYEIRNKQLVISDAQCNRIYSNQHINADPPIYMLQYCDNIRTIRLDNLAFDPDKIKEACSS